jgi:hypothetical protein
MAQIKVSNLPNTATVLANGDLILVSKDLGGSNYESQKMTQTDLRATLAAASNSWLLTGNAGTNPATDFVGTTDNRDVIFKRNNVERIRILSSVDYVSIGAPSPVSASLHIKRDVNLFQTATTLTSLAITDELVLDHNDASNPIFSINTLDSQFFKIIHRRISNGFGATIEVGNDSAGSNLDGISIRTGTGTNAASSYAAHLTELGELILGNNTVSSLVPLASNRAKLHVFSKGATAGTIAMNIVNTSNVELFKVWDHERIVTNRPSGYTPVAALDFYTTLLSTSNFMYMESGSGEIWEQKCNGNIVIGRDITAGSKLGIKGNTNAFVGAPTHALHVKGDVRVDNQLSATVGASSGQYLIINCDGTAYKIELFNT